MFCKRVVKEMHYNKQCDLDLDAETQSEDTEPPVNFLFLIRVFSYELVTWLRASRKSITQSVPFVHTSQHIYQPPAHVSIMSCHSVSV